MFCNAFFSRTGYPLGDAIVSFVRHNGNNATGIDVSIVFAPLIAMNHTRASILSALRNLAIRECISVVSENCVKMNYDAIRDSTAEQAKRNDGTNPFFRDVLLRVNAYTGFWDFDCSRQDLFERMIQPGTSNVGDKLLDGIVTFIRLNNHSNAGADMTLLYPMLFSLEYTKLAIERRLILLVGNGYIKPMGENKYSFNYSFSTAPVLMIENARANDTSHDSFNVFDVGDENVSDVDRMEV